MGVAGQILGFVLCVKFELVWFGGQNDGGGGD